MLPLVRFVEVAEAGVCLDLRVLAELLLDVMDDLALRAVGQVRQMISLSHVSHRVAALARLTLIV